MRVGRNCTGELHLHVGLRPSPRRPFQKPFPAQRLILAALLHSTFAGRHQRAAVASECWQASPWHWRRRRGEWPAGRRELGRCFWPACDCPGRACTRPAGVDRCCAHSGVVKVRREGWQAPGRELQGAWQRFCSKISGLRPGQARAKAVYSGQAQQILESGQHEACPLLCTEPNALCLRSAADFRATSRLHGRARMRRRGPIVSLTDICALSGSRAGRSAGTLRRAPCDRVTARICCRAPAAAPAAIHSLCQLEVARMLPLMLCHRLASAPRPAWAAQP